MKKLFLLIAFGVFLSPASLLAEEFDCSQYNQSGKTYVADGNGNCVLNTGQSSQPNQNTNSNVFETGTTPVNTTGVNTSNVTTQESLTNTQTNTFNERLDALNTSQTVSTQQNSTWMPLYDMTLYQQSQFSSGFQPLNQAVQRCGNPQGGNLGYCPLEPLYAGQSDDINTQGAGFGKFLGNIFMLLISLGALIAVVTLVIGGVAYMTSEATNVKGEAKKRMMSSIYGLLLLAASYLILGTINPQLLTVNLNPGAVTGPQTPNQYVSSGLNDLQGGTAGSLTTQSLNAVQTQAQTCESRGGMLIPGAPGGPCIFSN